jgi:L,D-transpeptidase YcbB
VKSLRFARDLSAFVFFVAAGLAPLAAIAQAAAEAQDSPLIQLDIPATPDLAETIGRDLAAEAGKPGDAASTARDTKTETAESAAAAPASEIKISEPANASAPASSDAPVTAETPASPGPAAVALIERAPEPTFQPQVQIDIPLPEPFVSFEGVETGETKSAEAPVQLDIPAQPEIVVVIDVPKAPEQKTSEPAATSRLALALDEAKIRALLEPHRTRLRLRPATIESFVAAYQARENRALWLDETGKPLAETAALAATLRDAGSDGLDSARLLALLPNVKSGEAIAPEQHAATDIAYSLAAFTFASDARGGRLDPRSLSAMLTPKLSLPTPKEVLAAIDSRGERQVSAVLTAYLPQHKGYQALRAELAKVRAAESEAAHTASLGGGSDRASLPERFLPQRFMGDAPLAIGQSDPRVPQLRARLRLPAADDLVYTGALVDAVKEFQRANDLAPNGRITPRTRALLDDPKAPLQRAEKRPDHARRIADLIANMERWRWLPPELGSTHVFVNIPEFRMEMQSEGERVFESRVIVGKVESQTPVFSDSMEFLVVNPSWTIPPTILKRDYLPKLAADPEYASRKGFEVIRRGNNISIRQPPGEKNALGHIKFMFPNDHAVYLHDTPTRHLFASGTRAFSAGCVRVEGPFRLADAMLRRQGFDEKTLRGMVGRGERTIRLQQRFPVHIAYFTLFVDQGGALQSKPDLYGHDARLRRALQL